MKRWLSTSLSHHCFIFHFHILHPELHCPFWQLWIQSLWSSACWKILSKKRKRLRRRCEETHNLATLRIKSVFNVSLFVSHLRSFYHTMNIIISSVHFDSYEYWVIIKHMLNFTATKDAAELKKCKNILRPADVFTHWYTYWGANQQWHLQKCEQTTYRSQWLNKMILKNKAICIFHFWFPLL